MQPPRCELCGEELFVNTSIKHKMCTTCRLSSAIAPEDHVPKKGRPKKRRDDPKQTKLFATTNEDLLR